MKQSLKDQALSSIKHDGHREKIAEGIRLTAMYVINGTLKEEPFLRYLQSEMDWFLKEESK